MCCVMALPWEPSRLKKPDPKQSIYENNRARDAYKKQLDIFNLRLEADMKQHKELDFDAKQEIRIRAKRMRETCLQQYRQNLQGLASSSHRRTYKDTFLGDREATFEMHDPVILEYELRLASEIDSIISNIALLNPDLSNKATIDWMSSLARQKYSYGVELDDDLPTNLLMTTNEPEPEEDTSTDIGNDLNFY